MAIKLGPFKKGAYGFNIDFTINNADGTAKDLTSQSVNLKAWISGASAVSISASLTVTSATIGGCRWTPNSASLTQVQNTPGYNAYLEITSAGYIEPTETFTISVDEAAP